MRSMVRAEPGVRGRFGARFGREPGVDKPKKRPELFGPKALAINSLGRIVVRSRLLCGPDRCKTRPGSPANSPDYAPCISHMLVQQKRDGPKRSTNTDICKKKHQKPQLGGCLLQDPPPLRRSHQRSSRPSPPPSQHPQKLGRQASKRAWAGAHQHRVPSITRFRI